MFSIGVPSSSGVEWRSMEVPFTRFSKISGAWLCLFFCGVTAFSLYKVWALTGSPAPFTYGEGIMTWMSWRMGLGEWPYGDILGVPSVYSCYGPLPAIIALALSAILPVPSSVAAGGELLFAGKILTFLSWVCVAACLASIKQPSIWQRALSAAVPVGFFSGTVFMYSWRIDPFLCAVLAGAMLYFTRRARSPSLAVGVVLALAVVTTKPTALVDFSLFFLMGVLLGGGDVKKSAPYMVKVLGAAVGALLLINSLSGGWMLNNIVVIQSLSGWKDLEGVSYGLKVLAARPMFPLVFFLLVIAFFRSDWRLSAVVWLATLFTLATHSKEGGAENYYMPLCVLVAPLAALKAGEIPGLKVLVGCWSLIFLFADGASGMVIKWSGRGGFLKTSRVEAAVRLFKDKDILSEDCLFPVMADKEPLVSDLFQLATVQSKMGGDLSPWLRKASGGVLGGGRIQHLCGLQSPSIEMQMGGGEWNSYYPSFRCTWNPSSPKTSPLPTLGYISFFMIVVAGLRLAFGRLMV